MKDDGGRAFPLQELTSGYDEKPAVLPGKVQLGLSVRDYFAAHALIGLVNLAGRDVQAEAELAYQYAEAMILVRRRLEQTDV